MIWPALLALMAALAPSLACSSGSAGGSPTGAGGSGGGGGAGATHNPLSQALIDRFVAAHNQARSGPLTPPPTPPLPPVAWDAVLADSAFGYLSKCVSADHALVDHNPNRTGDYAALGGSGYVGENIFGSTGTPTPEAAMTSWMSEASQFDYATSAIGTAGQLDVRGVAVRLRDQHDWHRRALHAGRLAGQRAHRVRDRRLSIGDVPRCAAVRLRAGREHPEPKAVLEDDGGGAPGGRRATT